MEKVAPTFENALPVNKVILQLKLDLCFLYFSVQEKDH